MLLLSEKQVQDLIDIDELITALEQAQIQYSTGRAVMPVRLVVPLPQIHGRIILLALKEKSISANAIHAEIGDVLAGMKPGRESASEITLYKSVGIAIQDVATANLVYRKALIQKVGTNVEI